MAKSKKDGFHHRATLKQKNKPFKSRHATKGALKQRNNGKVQRETIKGRTIKVTRRADRRNAAKLAQQRKRDALTRANRMFTGRSRAPKVVALVPLCPDVSSMEAAKRLFSSVDLEYPGGAGEVPVEGLGCSVHLHVDRFKQSFQLLQLPRHFWQILDATKVADYVVYVVSAEEEVDAFGEACLTAIQAQGCGGAFTMVQHLETVAVKNKTDVKKSLLSYMQHFFPENDRVYAAESEPEMLTLVRSLTGQLPKTVHWREWRPYLVVDKAEFQQESPENSSDPKTGSLRLTGFLRGAPLSANRLVHIPNHGDFQVSQVLSAVYPFQLNQGRTGMDAEAGIEVLHKSDPEQQDSLVAENEPDLLMNEQTWPTDEELQEAEERVSRLQRGEVGEGEMDLSMEPSLKTRRVPKGTSSYQAEWILESESDSEEDDESETEENTGMMDEELLHKNPVEVTTMDPVEALGKGSSPKVRFADDVEYEDVTLESGSLADGNLLGEEEEAAALEDLKSRQRARREANKDDLEFPDEVDTPMDFPARLRFQKYRGLHSFRTSPWDPYENLPLDYGRIFQFPSYKRAQRRAQEATEDAPVLPGTYVTLVLSNVPAEVVADWNPQTTLWPVFGLLPHEHKMSMVNFTVTRSSEYEEPVRSKDRLLLQYGYRRLWVNPVFSEHTHGSKSTNGVHKFTRFLQHGHTEVASCYVPIQFGPVHALFFHPQSFDHVCLDTGKPQVASDAEDLTPILTGARHPLVGTGALLGVDPTRIVAKRVLLTGEVFKVHQRSAVVRFMFFNREDITWFKPIQLHTKYGRTGHIREPVGTHGYMKCIFDGPVTQMDTACMSLYKRVFPKWTTSPCQSATSVLNFPQDWVAAKKDTDDSAMMQE
ncbi:ribosome biogenesis protein tsr1 [Dispira parvispora]|uniref:Ribosome biogenesis protein tsr1 n=2 Tax=Dispira parvispora TaxID=1520584 RepID=A0A9W8AN20_9FUNG|nr:ribosome biogenesis protein tsr1 [Dispira parvispora]